ncbi:MAG TPA: PilZ domain-containing protein [Thermoanaerobaculia bacterium]|nr:PilZ domain-containing protein [Thermoanaerobaculia bacterium]
MGSPQDPLDIPEDRRLTVSDPDPGRAARTQLILAVGLDAELESKLAPVLSRAEFEVTGASAFPYAARLAQLVRFDALLIARALEEDELHALLAGIRSPQAASAGSTVALFLPPDEMPLARAYLSAGVNQVVPMSLGASDLQAIVLGMLHAKLRLAARVMARLSVRIDGTVAQRLCQTLDLSHNGMFVITGERFPVGSELQFTLELARAGIGVRGEGRVVRYVAATRERPEGLGVSFLSFAGDGESRLVAFLKQLRG